MHVNPRWVSVSRILSQILKEILLMLQQFFQKLQPEDRIYLLEAGRNDQPKFENQFEYQLIVQLP